MPVGGHAISLLGHERQRIGFIQQPEFAFGRLFGAWIQEYTAANQRAMKISDERTDITRGVASRLLGPIEVSLDPLRKAAAIGFIHAVNPSRSRHSDVFLRQQVGADGRIEREHVDTLARRVRQHRAAAIDHIARGHLIAARLQDVPHHVLAVTFWAALQDGKDGADGNIGVDVARTIQRIE